MAPTDRTRRPRGSIDAEMIVRGAVELARRDGLDQLSMPALAKHLGIGVTSIYWYFKNKEELLRRMNHDAMLDDLRQSLHADDFEPGQWREFLRQQSVSARERFGSDDLLADLVYTRRQTFDDQTYATVLRHVEATLRLLVAAGFTPEDAWNLFWDLALYTRGFVATERLNRHPGSAPDQLRAGPHALESVPIIAGLVGDERLALDGTGDLTFEHGLDLMLDAASARLATG